MNMKQVVSLGVIAVGFLTIGYGAYSKRENSQVTRELQQINESKNKMIKSMAKDLEARTSHYDSRTKWYFIAGGILVLLGAMGAFHCRHKRRH